MTPEYIESILERSVGQSVVVIQKPTVGPMAFQGILQPKSNDSVWSVIGNAASLGVQGAATMYLTAEDLSTVLVLGQIGLAPQSLVQPAGIARAPR